jgi:Cdc6-like AAA superfamily ATPase
MPDYDYQWFNSKINSAVSSLSLKGPFLSTAHHYANVLQPDIRISRHLSVPTRELAAYYRLAFSVMHAHPCNSLLHEASSTVFVPRISAPTDPSSVVNTNEGHLNFVNDIAGNEINSMLIIGKRGSGKTLYLNYLINNQSESFYKQSHLVWYRADVSILHTQNVVIHDQPITDAIIDANIRKRRTLNEYLGVCISYVTFMYRNGYEIFEQIWSDKDTLLAQLSNKLYDSIPVNKRPLISKDKIIGAFLDYIGAHSIEILSTGPSISEMNKRIKDLLSNPFMLRICEHISNTILEYIRFKKCKLLLILDGADNLNYHHHLELYNQLMGELKEFVRHCDKLTNEDKIIISLRSETYEHLRELQFDLNTRGFEIYYNL